VPILIVEDEPGIKRLLAMELADAGFATVTAGTQAEAIDLAKRYAGAIECIIADVVLPDGSGLEVYETVYFLQPDVPTVFISGYEYHSAARKARKLGQPVEFLLKPFEMTQLQAAVERAMSTHHRSREAMPKVAHAHH
jgi:DNA-binding NtrC family response regulator